MTSTLSRVVCCVSVCWLMVSHSGGNNLLFAGDPVSFRKQIAPLLLEHCVACHGEKDAMSGYRVDTYAQVLKTGDSGMLPIEPGEGEASEFLRRLTTPDEFERMPAEAEPLSEEQVQLVADWIHSGAEFDGVDKDERLPFIIPPPRHPEPPANYSSPVPLTAIAFSPDGSQILAGGYHEITVWDASQGTLVRRISNMGQRVFAIQFSPDGSQLAVACGAPGKSGEVRLVDFASGEVTAVPAQSDDVIFDVAFRPGTKQLAIASADRQIKIVNWETLEVIHTLISHADWVTAVAWSGDGKRLASASRDKSAKVFDAETGQLLTSYKGHDAAVRGVTLLADGEQVLSTGTDGQLHRWEASSVKRTGTLSLGGEGYKLVLGDGFVLVPTADTRLLQVDPKTMQVGRAFEGLGDWALSTAAHAPSQRIAVGSFGGEIRVWDTESGQLVRSWIASP